MEELALEEYGPVQRRKNPSSRGITATKENSNVTKSNFAALDGIRTRDHSGGRPPLYPQS